MSATAVKQLVRRRTEPFEALQYTGGNAKELKKFTEGNFSRKGVRWYSVTTNLGQHAVFPTDWVLRPVGKNSAKLFKVESAKSFAASYEPLPNEAKTYVVVQENPDEGFEIMLATQDLEKAERFCKANCNCRIEEPLHEVY